MGLPYRTRPDWQVLIYQQGLGVLAGFKEAGYVTTKADATAAILRMEPGSTVTTYDYGDDFSIVRLDYARGKTFRPVSRNGKGWVIGDPPCKLPLYRVDEVRGAHVV